MRSIRVVSSGVVRVIMFIRLVRIIKVLVFLAVIKVILFFRVVELISCALHRVRCLAASGKCSRCNAFVLFCDVLVLRRLVLCILVLRHMC